MVGQPEIYTRRAFLARTAAATAAVVAGGGLLAACNDDGPPSGAVTPPPDDPLAGVMSVAVHPAIGIARVGNSADSFFFGPELPGAIPVAPDGFKDATGAIARQAARFRIYGYDAAGNVVREITGRRRHHRVDGERRQHQGRLVRLRHRPGHPRRQADEAPQCNDHRRRPRRPGRRLRRAVDQRARRDARRPRRRSLPGRAGPARRADDRRAGPAGVPAGRRPGLLPRAGPADDVLRQRRLGRLHVRRAGDGGGDDRRPHAAGRAGLGDRHAAELRPGDGDRDDHGLRLVAPRLGHRRRQHAHGQRRQLPRRHRPDLPPHRRHAVGQRRLPRLQRLGQ